MPQREEALYHTLCGLLRDVRYYLHFHERLATTWRRMGWTCSLTGALAGTAAAATAFAAYPKAAGWVALLAAAVSGINLVVRPTDHAHTHGDLARRYTELDGEVQALRDQVHRDGYTPVNVARIDELCGDLRAIRKSEPPGRPWMGWWTARRCQARVEKEIPASALACLEPT